MTGFSFANARFLKLTTPFWMDAVAFDIDPEASDFQLLEVLLRSDEYDHSYASPRPSPGHGMHGPYSLDSIAALSFDAIDNSRARDRIHTWLRAFDGESAESESFIEANLPDGSAVYELPDLRSTAAHEWGWVVGVEGFLEFVSIDRTVRALHLLVASDD